MGKISITLPYRSRKTSLSKKCLVVRLNISANTAPKEVFLGCFSILFFFQRSGKVMFENSYPPAVSVKMGNFFELIRIISETFHNVRIFFEGTVQTNLLKVSITTKTDL